MALAEVLAARAARKGRSAAVECGELGLLTVEALPVRECAALLRGPGGGRAVLYAACRELQAEGEALRRAGKLFRPDEIMDFVSEEEIAAAVQTVLTLSGLGGQAAGAGKSAAPASEPAPETDEKEAPERIREMDGAADGGDLSEIRPETVQDFAETVPEFRPETVRKNGAAPETAPAEERAERPASVREAVKQSPEIRPETVQNPEMDWATAPLPEAAGQVSREFVEEQTVSKTGLSELSGGQKTQSMVGSLSDEPQNLVDTEEERRASKNRAGGKTEPPGERDPERLHETRSDIMETGPSTVHEIKSEVLEGRLESLHETASDFMWAEPEGPHESESDFREAAHESESEFSERAHERKSEIAEKRREMMHESESELAERVARRLLEGLRRAAAVR